MAGLTERERELRTERASVREGQLPIIEKLNRGEKLSVEEVTDYTARDERLNELAAELKIVQTEQTRAAADADLDTRGAKGDGTETREESEWRAFEGWFKGGDNAITSEQRSLLTPQIKGVPMYEQRTGPAGDTAPLQTSPGSQGGFLVPPGFWHNLQIALKAYGGVYPHFRQVDTDSGQSMVWPTTNPTTIVAQLLTENTQVVPQDVTFGQGTLNAFTYVAGPFLASIQIMNDSAFSLDSFLRDRIAEAIGRAQAAAAWSGTGSAQPLGLTPALTAQGAVTVGAGTGGVFQVPAARKVYDLANQGTASTELVEGRPSFQSILDLITCVDPAYRTPGSDASWYMNDLDLQHIRSVTDTFGHPLWQPSVTVGGNEPLDKVYNYPVYIDQNAPSFSTVASTQGGPVFGSLSHAMVARNVRQTGVMVLRERYADFLAVAWLGYMRFDSRSNDMRAVATFKTNAT